MGEPCSCGTLLQSFTAATFASLPPVLSRSEPLSGFLDRSSLDVTSSNRPTELIRILLRCKGSKYGVVLVAGTDVRVRDKGGGGVASRQGKFD